MVDSPQSSINLQLGDIIEIISPDDTIFNNKQFFINYIDNKKIKLINIETNDINILTITNDNFDNNNIQSINILSRADSPSYAIQNNLIPLNWINIYFDSEIPFIITGQIINLEEDMIELKTTNDDVIFIDFEYKGMPESLPITKIELRNPPSLKVDPPSPLGESSEPKEVGTPQDPGESSEPKEVGTPQDPGESSESKEVGTPQDPGEQKEVDNSYLKQILLEGDEINFGEELDEITQIVDIDDSQKRFSLEQQTNDLLDDLLSNIPNVKRTNKLMNDIHQQIERFVQLRKNFSNFLDNGNVNPVSFINDDYKPLLNTVKNFSENLNWLIPITTYKKNIYDISPSILDSTDVDDINSLNSNEEILKLKELIDNYKSNSFDGDDNKYIHLYKNITKLLTPFRDPSPSQNIINTSNVNTNLTSIINNLSNFETSVANKEDGMLNIKKYLFDKYTIALKDSKNNNITKNDKLFLQGYLVLPIQFLLFSRINSKIEFLLNKVELSSINIEYEKILNNANINNQIVTNFEDSNFQNIKTNTFTEYSLSPELINDEEIFIKFLNTILPNNTQIFNNLKNTFENNLSYKKIINNLSTFNIYSDNINNNFFNVINDYLNENINNYKTYMIDNIKKYSKSRRTIPKFIENKFFKMLKTNKTIETIVLESYDISIEENLQTSEILNKILNTDHGYLFYNTIIKINFDLQTNKLVETLTKKYQKNIESLREQEASPRTCGSLTNKYNNIESLENDNGKIIFRDEIYAFNKESREQVIDNDYAILIESDDNISYFYRKNNEWIKDDKITQEANNKELDNEDFCNLFQTCYFNNNSCIDPEIRREEIEKETLNSIYKEFDDRYGKEEELIKENIDKMLLESTNYLILLKQIQKYNKNKYDNIKNKIGNLLALDQTNKELLKSPYEELRDIILGQTDFIKKQNDIQKFITYFTRLPNESEEQYWLYCNSSNAKLLPIFLKRLAKVYLSNGDYLLEIDKICSEQGTISDDGNQWVDKYSGYFIKNIDYDNEEGFTEEGFKLKTREILEQDLGDAVLKEMVDPYTDKTLIKDKEEVQMISNIITALSNFMTIDLKNQKDFIITNTLRLYEKLVPQIKKQFTLLQKKTLEKGSTMDLSIKDNLDQNLLIITLCYFLIAIQINIPSISSRKTFPGCIKSFTGYPINGTDKSAIKYVACVTNKIKFNSRPWSSIRKLKESSIIKRMETFIDNDILKQQVVLEKVNEKIEFTKTEQFDEKILVSDFVKLSNFFPPLQIYEIKQFSNITDTFRSKLMENLQTGNMYQNDQINIIKTKMVILGLLIQNKIQNIVEKNNPLLSTNSGKNYLENSCCDEPNINVHKYLLENDSTISKDKDMIQNLNKIIVTIKTLQESSLFFDPTNTKQKMIIKDNIFSEEIMYKGFVVFCNNKILNFSKEIRDICLQNNKFENDETIEEQIQKLKEDGVNYNQEMFEKILQLVNEKNSVYVNLNPEKINIIEKLRETINKIIDNDTDNDYIDTNFINKFKKILDIYGLEGNDNDAVRDFKNYVATQNELLMKYIINFVKINLRLTKSKFKKFENTLQNISIFKENDNLTLNEKDKKQFKIINFIKNVILQITKYFPYIIKNNVSYSNVSIPKHWKLSNRHVNDIKEIINKYYLKLMQFYDDPQLFEHINNSFKYLAYLIELSEKTPFFASYEIDGREISSIFDLRLTDLLFKYYLLKIIEIQIKYGENDILLDVDDTELLEDKKNISSDILSTYFISIFEIINNEKETIDYNYDSIMERVLRAKEKEKDDITEKLKYLSDDDRNIENIFKTHKLGDWGKGLQKGLTQYDEDTYDDERERLEQNALKEIKLGKNNLVTDLNKEIYSFQLDEQGIIDKEIEDEVNDLNAFDGVENIDDPEYGEDYYNNDGF